MGLSYLPEKSSGQKEEAVTRYSPYLVCRETASPPTSTSEERPPSSTSSSSSAATTYISLTKACLCVVRSLSEERDWAVLRLILSKMPTVLQNKAIITRYGKAIHMFVTPLVKLTQRDSGYPESLVNVPRPGGLSRAEFHNHVFPVLAAMASYNEFLVSVPVLFSRVTIFRV